MKNLAYLLTQPTQPYNQTEIGALLMDEFNINGADFQLIHCMEEFAELINVISENRVRGRVDTLHLIEEIADCYICVDRLKLIVNSNTVDIPGTLYKADQCLDNCISNLSAVIVTISKCLRKKSNAHMKMTTIISTVSETLYNLCEFYKVDNDSLAHIFQVKFRRIDERSYYHKNNA